MYLSIRLVSPLLLISLTTLGLTLAKTSRSVLGSLDIVPLQFGNITVASGPIYPDMARTDAVLHFKALISQCIDNVTRVEDIVRGDSIYPYAIESYGMLHNSGGPHWVQAYRIKFYAFRRDQERIRKIEALSSPWTRPCRAYEMGDVPFTEENRIFELDSQSVPFDLMDTLNVLWKAKVDLPLNDPVKIRLEIGIPKRWRALGDQLQYERKPYWGVQIYKQPFYIIDMQAKKGQGAIAARVEEFNGAWR